jgi:hypothetical protein
MATYYKYADREASNYINWTEISKNLNDTLSEESKRREDLKAQLDKSSSDFGQKLDNSPQGEYTPANTWIIDASSKGQEMRLIQDQLLKSGKWNLQQYLSARRNTEGDFKGMFDLAKEYQDEYKVKLEAYKSQKTSQATLDLMGSTQGLANLQNTSLYINPTTGVANLGVKKLNPGTGVYEMTNDFASVQSLRNRIKMDIPKYDLAELKTDVSTLGETTIARLKDVAGMNRVIAIESETDPTKRQALIDEESKKDPLLGTYLSWEDNMVQSKMDNKLKVTSILTDFLRTSDGKNYKQTLNEAEFKNDKTGLVYLMKDDGSGILKPTFNPEQEKAVEGFVRDQYRNMITRTQKIDVATEPDIYRPDASILQINKAAADKKKESFNNLNKAGQLYYGTNEDIESARTYFLGVVPNAKDITRNADGVVVTFNDNTKFPLPFKDENGNLIPQDKWIEGAVALHGIKDTKTAIKESGYDASKAFNTESEGSSSIQAPVSPEVTKFNTITTGKDKDGKLNWNENIIKIDDGKATAANLTTILGPLNLGLTFSGEGIAYDYVNIFKKDGKLLEKIQVDNSNGSAKIQEVIRKYVEDEFPSNPKATTKTKASTPTSRVRASPQAQRRIGEY